MKGRISVLLLGVLAATFIIAPQALAISVTAVSPTGAHAGATVDCTVSGSYADLPTVSAPEFSLVHGTTIIAGTLNPDPPWGRSRASVRFAIPSDTPPARYDMVVRQRTFLLPIPTVYTGSLADAFEITVPDPVITNIAPNSASAGSGDLNLALVGADFLADAVVCWNAVELATTRLSATKLTATVPATLLVSPGVVLVTVRNGAAAGAPVSNAMAFGVGAVVPALTSIAPTQVWAGYLKPVTLTVTGSGFLGGAHVMLGAAEKTATIVVSATQLTTQLAPADIAASGTIDVGVKNPLPSGTVSATTLPLTVVPETSHPGVTIDGADSVWHNAAVPLTFMGTDLESGVQDLQYRAPSAVASWVNGGSYTVPVTAQGTTTVEARILDWCGNLGSASATVRIDTTKPQTEALNDVNVRRFRLARLHFRVTEPSGLSPSAKVVIRIRRSTGHLVKTITFDSLETNVEHIHPFTVTFAGGLYRWCVYATDLAGNVQEQVAQAVFRVR
jgi:hypothetical protein